MAKVEHDRAELELRINGLREVFIPYERVTAVQSADSGVMSPRVPGNCRLGFRDEVARDSDIVSPTIPRFGRPV